jgi:hypothetical protein
MKTETWLKIGSVLIYLFVPAFVIRLFFGFVEILFLVQVSEMLSVSIVGFSTAITVMMGIILIFGDEYILKQKK